MTLPIELVVTTLFVRRTTQSIHRCLAYRLADRGHVADFGRVEESKHDVCSVLALLHVMIIGARMVGADSNRFCSDAVEIDAGRRISLRSSQKQVKSSSPTGAQWSAQPCSFQ